MIKSFFITFIISFFIFLSQISLSSEKNDNFFKICNLQDDEVEIINYLLKNGNSRMIPFEINDIHNEVFKKSLYLYMFYRDRKKIPDDLIDYIGVDDVKKIKILKPYVISYLLTNEEKNDEKFLTKTIEDLSLDTNIKISILKDRNFSNQKYPNLSKQLLQNVMYNDVIEINDLMYLYYKYRSLITDDYLLQQVRHNLWNKRIYNVEKIKRHISSLKIKEQVDKIVDFTKKIDAKKTITTTDKSGKKITKIVNALTMNDVKKMCKKNIGIDQYINLLCLVKTKTSTNNMLFIENMLEKSQNPIFLPQKWLKYRIWLARENINNTEHLDKIYDIIANAGSLTNGEYYTQQFLSGLIAYLREDFDNAIIHFSTCTIISSYDEYNAKANYWLGLCYRHKEDFELMKKAFSEAKRHPHTMYGQLATDELGEDPEINLEKHILSFYNDREKLCQKLDFVIGYIERYDIKQTRFLSALLKNFINKEQDKNDLFNAIGVVNDDFGIDIAKIFALYALRYDVIFDDKTFPISNASNDSLVNAVIKKETNFKKGVIGTSGERGLMQVMPSTGKVTANSLGITYDKHKLLHDEHYNVKIGSKYLDKLLRDFDNNKLLALASYNGGSGNVSKWIKKNGDPREMQTYEQIVVWIEKIPFYFTRSYVVNILGHEMTYDVLKRIFTKKNDDKVQSLTAVIND